jgi:PAS domain S-box-containing protein
MGQMSECFWEWVTKNLVKPLAIAGFFVLVALLWTFPLQHIVAYPFVFLFFGAVMGSAWFGGFIAGTIAIIFSSLVVTFFFIPPLYSLVVAKELRTFEASFILCAIAITAISGARKRIEIAVRNARDELETKVQERTAELQQSNMEILERERQLRLLTEAIPQQIWRANSAGIIEYCNHDLTGFTGKSMEDLLGENFFNIFHEEDRSLLRQNMKAALLSGNGFEVRARVRGADGNNRWFLIRSIPQHTAAGDVSCWYGVHIDIDEQYRAQQAILQAQEDSARWSRTFSMAEMAVSIAHELKQPLTAVVSHAQACRRWLRAQPMNAEKASAAAENLVRESTRASAVIDRVRSLFSHTIIVREPADLNQLVQNIVHLLRDDAIRQGIAVRLQLADNLPSVNVDPIQIQQLLLNLAMNGIESTAGTGRPRELAICTELNHEGKVMVTVIDNGSGLNEQVKGRLFEPFFTTKPQGTGIGLAICRSIVEAHDGHIWVSSLTEGTAFHFTLGAGE